MLCQRVSCLPFSMTTLRTLSTLTSVHMTMHQDIRPGASSRPSNRGWRAEKGFARPGYPEEPVRTPGADLNLQERLDELYAEEKRKRESKRDIGVPKKKNDSAKERKQNLELTRMRRSDPTLEKAARQGTLKVDTARVVQDRLESGAVYDDIQEAAELYGVFDDLFGDDAFFTPNTNLQIHFDSGEDFLTPVYRGNIIKPREAKSAPSVEFQSDPDSLWTLALTTPDGHFTDESKEYLHWMVANIKGSDISSGEELCNYLQPFPPFGTGYFRYIFVLYKQTSTIDLSKEKRPANCNSLKERTFSTRQFFEEHKKSLIPSGLAFFQADWDSSLRDLYHNMLNMKEPRYEYHFIDTYRRPWTRFYPHIFRVPFNVFLDKFRDPKEVEEELVRKKLKIHHPFEGDLEKKQFKYINAHEIDGSLPQWRRREIERERLRQGVFHHLDWQELRRDPSNA